MSWTLPDGYDGFGVDLVGDITNVFTGSNDELNNHSQIENNDAENNRIRERIESRRILMEAQTRADEAKFKLCNKIQEEKSRIPGLKEKVASLEESDPDLFKYIRYLEYIHAGIWCPRCHVQKVISARYENASIGMVPQNSSQVESVHAYKVALIENLQEQCIELERRLEDMATTSRRMSEEYSHKMRELIGRLSVAEGELNLLREQARRLRGEISQSPNAISADVLLS